MKAKDFDADFDSGRDVTKALDLNRARRIKEEAKRINVDFPVWMIEELDKEANRLGVTRQSIIKIWLVERLERSRTQEAS